MGLFDEKDAIETENFVLILTEEIMETPERS
jgi:hypothetical protein